MRFSDNPLCGFFLISSSGNGAVDLVAGKIWEGIDALNAEIINEGIPLSGGHKIVPLMARVGGENLEYGNLEPISARSFGL